MSLVAQSTTDKNMALNKSQLAKLLAAENLTVVHSANARTASFDTEKRILVLPIWMNMTAAVYDLLVGHEVGHALYTDSEELVGGLKTLHAKLYPSDNFETSRSARIVQQVVNVIEDPRIEKLTKRRYPGIRASFNLGYKTLFEQGFFKVSMMNLSKLSLTDRLNLHFKVGTHIRVPFSAVELPLVAMIESCETMDDVFAAAETVILHVRNNPQQQQQPQQPQQQQTADSDFDSDDDEETGTDGEADYDEYDTDDPDFDHDDGESDSDDDGAESEVPTGEGADGEPCEDGELGEAESDSEDDDESENDAEENNNTGDRGTGDVDETSDVQREAATEGELDGLQSLTEAALAEGTKSLAEGNVFMITLTSPDIDLNAHAHDYKQVMRENREYFASTFMSPSMDSISKESDVYKISERTNISYMLKEFELRRAARTHARTMQSKTGRLDTNKLHSYKISDDLFRRNTVVNRGQSHGLFFLVDFSGSMSYCIQDLMKSLTSLTMFCRLSNIPFEVYTFTDNYTAFKDGQLDTVARIARRASGSVPTSAPTDANIDKNFFLRNILSSRMNLKEYNEACVIIRAMANGQSLVDRMGGTPLAQALMACVPMVEKFKKSNGLDCISFVTMTDGMSDGISGNSLVDLRNEMAYKPGYVTYLDKVTKKSYTAYIKNANYCHYMTSTLCGLIIKSIQDRFNANTIGYFIGDKKNIGPTLDQLGVTGGDAKDWSLRSKLTEQYKDEGFITVPALGYDEYFIISPKTFAMNTSSENDYQKPAGDVSVRKVFSDFKRQIGRRDRSRTLFKSFVARITAKDAA